MSEHTSQARVDLFGANTTGQPPQEWARILPCGCTICRIGPTGAVTVWCERHRPEGLAAVASGTQEHESLRQRVLVWLGHYRDYVPTEAVSRLQDILGVSPLEGNSHEAG